MLHDVQSFLQRLKYLLYSMLSQCQHCLLLELYLFFGFLYLLNICQHHNLYKLVLLLNFGTYRYRKHDKVHHHYWNIVQVHMLDIDPLLNAPVLFLYFPNISHRHIIYMMLFQSYLAIDLLNIRNKTLNVLLLQIYQVHNHRNPEQNHGLDWCHHPVNISHHHNLCNLYYLMHRLGNNHLDIECILRHRLATIVYCLYEVQR